MDTRYVVGRIVRNALSLATAFPTVEDFDAGLYEQVSKEIGLTPEEVRKVHHPVWWYLTLSGKGPLKYYQPRGKGKKPRVGLNGVDRININKLIEGILEEHGPLLEAKLERIFNIRS